MLRKLIKHEMSETSRIILPLIAYSLIAGIVAGGLIAGIIYASASVEASPLMTLLVSSMGITTFILILAIFAVSTAVFIILIYRFYKTMFSDEGYLTFTLPVLPGNIVFSKFITAYIWIILTALAVIIDIGIIAVTATLSIGVSPALILSFIKEIYLSIAGAIVSDGYIIPYLIETVIYALISPMLAILTAYTAVTIGCQLTSKHKLLASIGFYFVINTCSSIIFSVISGALTMLMISVDPMLYMIVSMGINIVLVVIICIIFDIIIRRTISRKLNLE